MNPILLLLICFASLFATYPASGQAPAPSPPPPPIQVREFKPEPANAPGGGNWVRLLAAFRSLPAWADGLAFYYDILVEKDGQFRVLSGTARYSNVKAGSHVAVLFMSPSAVARFGAPVAAQVGVGYNDELMESFNWKAPNATAPEGWSTQFERYSDQLLPIYLTPFVATEYGKYPDVMSVR
jgi:hypothetical protein